MGAPSQGPGTRRAVGARATSGAMVRPGYAEADYHVLARCDRNRAPFESISNSHHDVELMPYALAQLHAAASIAAMGAVHASHRIAQTDEVAAVIEDLSMGQGTCLTGQVTQPPGRCRTHGH